uniref:Unnamed protein product n=1 Tax=Macaca fascicularis TaxID=9541 RepID=Q9N0D7_MACFA|nr:unnamed protein product [Macaca fascicularis]
MGLLHPGLRLRLPCVRAVLPAQQAPRPSTLISTWDLSAALVSLCQSRASGPAGSRVYPDLNVG